MELTPPAKPKSKPPHVASAKRALRLVGKDKPQLAQQIQVPHVPTKPRLVRRPKRAAAIRYTVDYAPVSRGTWQFRIRVSGGKRSVVYRSFVDTATFNLITKGDYEQWKTDFIADWLADQAQTVRAS